MSERDPALPSHATAWRRRLPLLPALLFTIVLTQVPFVMSIYYSLTNWKVVPPTPREFIGFDNYTGLADNQPFLDAAWVSIKMTVLSVLLSLVLGTLLALLLDRKFLGQGLVRTLLITPFLIMPVVAGLIWKNQMFHGLYGVVNWALEQLGLGSVEFVSRYPLASIVTVLVWQWTPFMMLILLAGLQSRPLDVVEAARIDGANSWQIFWHMTLPHLRQYIELATLLGAIYVVQNFDHVFTITAGGLGTANLPYFIYQTFYTAQDYGRASAAGVVVVIATILIAMAALRTVFTMFNEESR